MLQNSRTTLQVENEIALNHDHLGANVDAGELHMENGKEPWYIGNETFYLAEILS